MNTFSFEFSLEVLNHLGRGLYRNFATVVAEAISNSWDAEATEVRITIDKEKKVMTIFDNGKGMNASDFQGKFLKVGYSRRTDENNKSRRKVLGRKGIGKLAMLSISEKVSLASKKKVSLASKKKDESIVSGVIDNTKLDRKIEDDGQYTLNNISEDIKQEIYAQLDETGTGTYIKFEGIKDTVNNPELIKKYLAVIFSFSFSFSNEIFDIYVNSEKVSIEDLVDLNSQTQFLWNIDLEKKFANKIKARFSNIKGGKHIHGYKFEANGTVHSIKGYVASVEKPSNLKIRGTEGEFKAGLHLFVNGRLRQEDVFKDIASQRIVESYLYGEIHVDSLDDGDDIFTSSREGVIKDSKEYTSFLDELKKIQKTVLEDWDEWREKKPKDDASKMFGDLRPDKQKAINAFLKNKEDDNLKEKFLKGFLPSVIKKVSDKKILISHARDDKNLADKIYNSLLHHGFEKSEIIYTSSKDKETRLPQNTDIFDYLRKFFLQDWRDNHPVIFVVSEKLEKSWFASLEAGAVWVTKTKHNLAVEHNYDPKDPFQTRHLYIKFDAEGNYEDAITAEQIFESLKTK